MAAFARTALLLFLFLGSRWPLDVLHHEHVRIVGLPQLVAELTLCTLCVATAEGDLFAPHAARAALREHVIFGAKEEVRDERPTDAVVP